MPLVKKSIKELQGQGGERPHKVNVFAVSKKLGLSDKRLYLLPKCMKEVLKHQESQEQYWAKEVIWAINKIQNDGISLNWKQVRVLTNMRKANLIATLPYLEEMDLDIAEKVRAIV